MPPEATELFVSAHLNELSKSYGKVQALDGIDFSLRAGEVTAFLGPNGAGKTTAIRCLLGLTQPDHGTVEVFRKDPASRHVKERTGVMLQIGGIPETLRVGEHVRLFSSYYPAPLPYREILSKAGLFELEHRPYGKLSGGQQRRLLFALAICGNPDLLVLDEPTVALDVTSRRALWDEVRRCRDEGKTVVLATHHLDEAEALADRILVFNQGRVAADGTAREIKGQAAAGKVRCRTALDSATVATWPGVLNIRSQDGTLEARVAAPEPIVRRLLAEDPQLTDLEVSSASLEEAFLGITQTAQEPTLKEAS